MFPGRALHAIILRFGPPERPEHEISPLRSQICWNVPGPKSPPNLVTKTEGNIFIFVRQRLLAERIPTSLAYLRVLFKIVYYEDFYGGD